MGVAYELPVVERNMAYELVDDEITLQSLLARLSQLTQDVPSLYMDCEGSDWADADRSIFSRCMLCRSIKRFLSISLS